jgi:hypothetical protein
MFNGDLLPNWPTNRLANNNNNNSEQLSTTPNSSSTTSSTPSSSSSAGGSSSQNQTTNYDIAAVAAANSLKNNPFSTFYDPASATSQYPFLAPTSIDLHHHHHHTRPSIDYHHTNPYDHVTQLTSTMNFNVSMNINAAAAAASAASAPQYTRHYTSGATQSSSASAGNTNGNSNTDEHNNLYSSHLLHQTPAAFYHSAFQAENFQAKPYYHNTHPMFGLNPYSNPYNNYKKDIYADYFPNEANDKKYV